MRVRWSRTAIAAGLTAAGVLVPCAAWYAAGSKTAHAQASRLEEWPRRQAQREAARLARQIGLRLEALRQSETRRPFGDYLSDERFGQLLGACAQDAIQPSPLAEGPVDPLIWAHFQIDDVGVITTPVLRSAALASTGREGPVTETILNEIECASSEHLAALRRRNGSERSRETPSAQGVVTVGPLSWHAAVVENGQALIAIREVSTPLAVLTQGFVVPLERLRSLLDGSLYPARILPGEPGDETEAMIPLQGDSWMVQVDASAAVAAAAAEAARIEARFRGTFAFGAAAALLAGGLVVLLVHQTERTSHARARFAASAAHELRTPLAGLRLYGEMLADGGGDPSRRKLYAQRVADEADRLGRVVSNVLGYSKLERGTLGVTVREGDLEQAVRTSIERLRPGLESTGVPLELRSEGPLPRALFDPDALHQILQNLIDNAAKFNREANDRTVRVVLGASPHGVTLEVIDRGRGVDARIRRRLFEPFVHHPVQEAEAGLGIGLAMVRELARAQGARVSHRDPPEGGAAFTVRFRRAA